MELEPPQSPQQDTLAMQRLNFAIWCSEKFSGLKGKMADEAAALYSDFDSYVLSPQHTEAIDGLIALNKPPYVNSQRGSNTAEYSIDEIATLATGTEIYSINRLDQNTSGVVFLGSTDSVLKSLNKQMGKRKPSNKNIAKKYVAIADGAIGAQAGVIAPLHFDSDSRMAIIDPENPHAKQAVSGMDLLAEVVDPADGRVYSVVEVELFTGRTHQIRAHMEHINLPIVGDHKYNPNPSGAERQLLHSHTSTIRRPNSTEYATFVAPVPDDFYAFLNSKELIPTQAKFYDIFPKYQPELPPAA